LWPFGPATSRLPRLHFSRITISRNASFRLRVFGSQCLPTASSFSHESPVTSHQSLLWNKLPFQCFPQFCSTRAELVIVHTMAFRRTVIRTKLSAWTCQPFCCQRAFTLIPSGPQHSAEISRIAPENKKPGVERRAKPPYQWLCAKLDIFLACARKEPHYRIYFWPSLDLTLGRTFSSTRL